MRAAVCWLPLLACAATWSRVAASSLGGAYEVADPGCQSCLDPSAATGSCSCAAGQTPFAVLRTINDCSGIHGGDVVVCSTPVGTAFGSVYEQDDAVPGGEGCRAPNPMTGGCSCPAGYIESSIRTLADTTPGKLVGSTMVYCLNPSGADRYFAGVYQSTDQGTCLHGNEYNGGQCACPGGYVPSGVRVIVDGPLGSWAYFCVKPTPPVELCAGVYADPTGQSDATAAIQQCIDATPSGGTFALPGNSVFGISSQVSLNAPINLQTAGIAPGDASACVVDLGGQCATLRALPGCCSPGGVLAITSGAAGSTVSHITIDGNRDARLNTPQAQDCIDMFENRARAMNMFVMGVSSVSWLGCASVNALCGTGCGWNGDNCAIENSYFANNGDHDSRVSDGLTLGQCRNGVVRNLRFVDNSDVNFIQGCGAGTTIDGISVSMSAAQSFAGVMLDNFDGTACGDYVGMSMTNVNIECGVEQCDFGLEVGPSPWYQPNNIYGGTINGVTISGSKQGVNVAGGGVPQYPVTIVNVGFGTGFPQQAQFNCGAHSTSAFNIAPGSYVNRDGQSQPTSTAFPWTNCA